MNFVASPRGHFDLPARSHPQKYTHLALVEGVISYNIFTPHIMLIRYICDLKQYILGGGGSSRSVGQNGSIYRSQTSQENIAYRTSYINFPKRGRNKIHPPHFV